MRRRIAAIAALLFVAAAALYFTRAKPGEAAYRRAIAYLHDGDFDNSLKVAHSAAVRWQNHPNSEWRSKFRLLEAEILLEQNKDAEATRLLDEEAGRSERWSEAQIVRATLKARQYLRHSQFDKATESLREARQLAVHAGRRDLQAEVDLRHGELLGRQRRIDEAEKALEQARQIATELNDAHRLARAALGLGMVRMFRSRCDQAIPLFEEARSLSKELGTDYTSAGAANNLGMCYAQLGDFDTAIAYREEATKLARPSARMAEVLGETGTLHLAKGDPEKAIPYYRRALGTAKRFGILPEAARWAGNLTLAFTSTGDWNNAENALSEALGLKPEPRSRVFLQLNAAAIAHGRGRAEEAITIYEQAIASAPENAAVQWRAHAGLAEVLLSLGEIERANRSFEAAIRVIEGNQADLNRSEHKITFLSRLIRFYDAYVDALISQNQPVAALKVADSSRARIMAERLSQMPERRSLESAEAFQRIAADSKTVWLCYWTGTRRSFLWVVTAKEVRSFVLPPASQLSALVEEFRGFVERSMRDPLQSDSEAGRRLYDTLIAPARALIPDGAHIVLLPDGALHQLNFEALPVYGENPHYWIDEVTVSIAPSFGIFRPEKQQSAAEKTALIIGDPVSPAPEYPALPHAGAEIASIGKRFGSARTKTVVRDAAYPGSYAAAEPENYSIIHLAAHAEANVRSPLDSAVILSRAGDGFKLYARDIIRSPLRADLVTLSACRTSGARTYAGEGLVGLTWAFLQAGAHSVVAGLWDVSDESTAWMMDRFYAEIAGGASPPDALRRAKLALRQTAYSKPYYWAPFQCYIR
jgi:CHAT domain-containing protein